MNGEDREARADRNNDVIKKRYFTIIERMKAKLSSRTKRGYAIRSNEKYQDELFPPIASSVFRGGSPYKPFCLQASAVKWVRLPDLFKDRSLCVLPIGRSSLETYCNRWEKCSNFIGDAFTAIKDCRVLL